VCRNKQVLQRKQPLGIELPDLQFVLKDQFDNIVTSDTVLQVTSSEGKVTHKGYTSVEMNEIFVTKLKIEECHIPTELDKLKVELLFQHRTISLPLELTLIAGNHLK
jgi:hypothetical protein